MTSINEFVGQKLTVQDVMVLRQCFVPTPITPKMTMEEIQYEAGQQAVLDWIETKVRSGSGINI